MKRYLLPLTMIVIVFSLAHYYIFRVVTGSFLEPNLFTQIFGAILAVTIFALPSAFFSSLSKYKKQLSFVSWIGFIWLGFFQIIFFFTLVETIISVINPHLYSYWVLIASILISLWALYKGLKKPTLIRHKITGPESLKGFSLVQVSDLHIGLLHLNQKWLASVVERVNEIKPHAFAITGDLVEGAYKEVSPQLAPLKDIHVNIEKFYITGNHEYIHGSGPWELRLKELGYHTLHNENLILTYQQAKILVAGVPDRMAPRFDRNLASLPDVALKTNQKVNYKILLAHEPASIWDMKTETCDLLLSGHTHGGQIFPFGVLVRIAQPVVRGFKKFGSTLVFAHMGTGLWGPPMRWFTRSEIVLIEWE
ncbi:MAG: metallophosphoesterase [Bdellovibrio sp.]|nr:metallophosphoesterase [Bdellovibrio sp.]